MRPWCPPDHRLARLPFEGQREICGVRWPRTCQAATGLSAAERRSVSDRRARPGTTGCIPTVAAARRHSCRMTSKVTPVAPTGGIDWATDTNELCIVAPTGEVVHRSNTTMDAAGIRRLVGQLERHSVGRVAIERPDGPVVDACWPPASRSWSSRHDRSRTCGPATGRPATKTTGSTRSCSPTPCAPTPDCWSRSNPTPRRPSRCVLPCGPGRTWSRPAWRCATSCAPTSGSCSPARSGLFSDLDSPISLTFLTRFPTADKAAWLSVKRLGAWLSANRYSGRTKTATLLERLDLGAGRPHR
jgi:hypothetical protein